MNIAMQTTLDHNKLGDSICTSQLLTEAHKPKDTVTLGCDFLHQNCLSWGKPTALMLTFYISFHSLL